MKSSMTALAICIALSVTSAHAKCRDLKQQIKTVKTVASVACIVPGVNGYCNIAKAANKLTNLDQKVSKAVADWNEIASDNSHKIGARLLQEGQSKRGTIVTQRAYLSDGVIDGTVDVSITPTRKNKARLFVEFCGVNGSGEVNSLKEVVFPKNTPRGETITKRLKLDGEVLMVYLRTNGLKKFHYEIAADHRR